MRFLPALAAPLLLLVAPMPVSAARTGTTALTYQSHCPKPAVAPNGRLFNRLVDLPPANAYQAVLRSDQRGCAKAIPVRRNIGRPR